MKEAETKAKELIEKFTNADYQDMSIYGVKSCALICVDEKIEEASLVARNPIQALKRIKFLQEVKQILTDKY